jgi:hypothetical protein
MVDIALFTRKSRLCSIVLAAVAFVPFAAHAQQQPPKSPITPIQSQSPRLGGDASTPGFGNTNPRDPDQARMLKGRGKERNDLRQKQIVDETNHLLDLAKQLKDAVDKSSKDQLSLEVVNTATEIEKLAKTVKEKMRDGQ